MQKRRLHVLTLVAGLLVLAACGTPLTAPLTAGGASRSATADTALDKLPLYFVANQGQTDPQVSFYVPGQGNTIYFSPAGLTFALTAAPSVSAAQAGVFAQTHDGGRPGLTGQTSAPLAEQRWAVKLDFVGANPATQLVGEDQTAAVFSYFTGQQAQWKTGVSSYAQIRYANLWPGIDLVYSGQGHQMKYEFEVQPGADPAQIQLAYRGASAVQLTPGGQLAVTTPAGGFQDAAPVAYQMKNGQRVPVAMRYALNAPVGAGAAATHGYSFQLGAYDRALSLILDPTVLIYAGYIGGAGIDDGNGIAIDKDGNAYIAGETTSAQATFPVRAGPDLTANGATDAFVAKVNAAGTALVYAGYIGGADSDIGQGIAVDKDGNAYVTGWTESDENTFPVRGGPGLIYKGVGLAASNAFVAKVNAAGTALVYAGYIGGAVYDVGTGIAVDSTGNAYVVGYTGSDQTSFPVKIGPDLSYNGGNSDTFVAKVNAAGSALVYAGYIGGSDVDNGNGIAIDKDGNAYVTGYTLSSQATFPIATGPHLTYYGNGDGFVAKVNAAGTALTYAGYIGGSFNDSGNGIAVDGVGNAYVTGDTQSDQSTFPVSGGPDLTHNGGQDAFVAKVNLAGTALVYAGYIGGAGDDVGLGIAVDNVGNAYVTGDTHSDQSTFPVKGGPDLTYNGATDAFVAKLNPAGTTLAYAGYIGGSSQDIGYGIAADNVGNAYVTGSTESSQTTFPVTTGPYLTFSGVADAFVAKVNSFVPTAFLFLPLVRR